MGCPRVAAPKSTAQRKGFAEGCQPLRSPVNRRALAALGVNMGYRYVSLLVCGLVAGCATSPPPPPAPPPQPRPSPTVYYYPLRGQTAEQQDRDRYECYLSARQRSGYDPSLVRPEPPAVKVAPVPPAGHDVVAGAATGAVIGAVVSQPWQTAEGAAIGAAAGAVLGAVSDSARQQQADRVQAAKDQERGRANAQVDAAVIAYRNAMQACLEARGYSVR